MGCRDAHTVRFMCHVCGALLVWEKEGDTIFFILR